MTKEKKLEAERQELNRLIENGVTFEVERTVTVQRSGILGFFKPGVQKKETLKYTIEEPTLSTLDRISAEQIDLPIDENVMSSNSGVQEAKKLVAKHGKRMAKIVALAVLGQDYLIQRNSGGRVRYDKDEKRLNELTEIFFNNIKPSKLVQLTILINTMCNLGDFTNSIRLMSASRTTMPILIEENKKD